MKWNKKKERAEMLFIYQRESKKFNLLQKSSNRFLWLIASDYRYCTNKMKINKIVWSKIKFFEEIVRLLWPINGFHEFIIMYKYYKKHTKDNRLHWSIQSKWFDFLSNHILHDPTNKICFILQTYIGFGNGKHSTSIFILFSWKRNL